MFGMLESFTKAAISVAVTPVTAAVDVVMMPIDAVNEKPLCGRTQSALNSTAKNFNDAVKPNSK